MTMMYPSSLPLLPYIHFEICMRTRPNGWVAHAAGADNFLLKIGPHACRTHQMHAILLALGCIR